MSPYKGTFLWGLGFISFLAAMEATSQPPCQMLASLSVAQGRGNVY